MTGFYIATCAGGSPNTLWGHSHETQFSFVGDQTRLQFHSTGTSLGLPYDVTTDFWFMLYSGGSGLGTVTAGGQFIVFNGANYVNAQCSFGSDELLLTRLPSGTD
ncbi:MAG: hypothetical protein ACRDKE_02475, partial [Solirubrobacterales bacterium]